MRTLDGVVVGDDHRAGDVRVGERPAGRAVEDEAGLGRGRDRARTVDPAGVGVVHAVLGRDGDHVVVRAADGVDRRDRRGDVGLLNRAGDVRVGERPAGRAVEDEAGLGRGRDRARTVDPAGVGVVHAVLGRDGDHVVVRAADGVDRRDRRGDVGDDRRADTGDSEHLGVGAALAPCDREGVGMSLHDLLERQGRERSPRHQRGADGGVLDEIDTERVVTQSDEDLLRDLTVGDGVGRMRDRVRRRVARRRHVGHDGDRRDLALNGRLRAVRMRPGVRGVQLDRVVRSLGHDGDGRTELGVVLACGRRGARPVDVVGHVARGLDDVRRLGVDRRVVRATDARTLIEDGRGGGDVGLAADRVVRDLGAVAAGPTVRPLLGERRSTGRDCRLAGVDGEVASRLVNDLLRTVAPVRGGERDVHVPAGVRLSVVVAGRDDRVAARVTSNRPLLVGDTGPPGGCEHASYEKEADGNDDPSASPLAGGCDGALGAFPSGGPHLVAFRFVASRVH